MTQNAGVLLEKLAAGCRLDREEWTALTASDDPGLRQASHDMAEEVCRARFGRGVYFRSIVEFTSFCKNGCRYCGIRQQRNDVPRYRLDAATIAACCRQAWELGIKTFVLQGGEDPAATDDRLVPLIRTLNREFPGCRVTLSLGERSAESYRRLREAGASRYLLRHETADPLHYRMMHMPEQSFEHRMACLRFLRDTGWQTGCGMMIGSPGQTPAILAEDMLFMQSFRPHMIGMGPFLPSHGTPFAGEPHGSGELTLFMLSLCRLMLPDVLLPSTTALRTLLPDGCARGILAGCNVLMPNFTPQDKREGYHLYDGKPSTGGKESYEALVKILSGIGRFPAEGPGDWHSGNSNISTDGEKKHESQ